MELIIIALILYFLGFCFFYIYPWILFLLFIFIGYKASILVPKNDRIIMYIINFIAWFTAWFIAIFMSESMEYSHYNILPIQYISFGIFLIILCIPCSCYLSYKIITSAIVQRYIKENWHKIKEPIFITILCCVMIYTINHTGIMTHRVYRSKNIFDAIFKFTILFLETTFLSILYAQLYKIFRNR